MSLSSAHHLVGIRRCAPYRQICHEMAISCLAQSVAYAADGHVGDRPPRDRSDGSGGKRPGYARTRHEREIEQRSLLTARAGFTDRVAEIARQCVGIESHLGGP